MSTEQEPGVSPDEELAQLREKLTGTTPELQSREHAKKFVQTYRGLSSESLRVLASAHAVRGEKHVSWLPAVLAEIDGLEQPKKIVLVKKIFDVTKLHGLNLIVARQIADHLLENYNITERRNSQ